MPLNRRVLLWLTIPLLAIAIISLGLNRLLAGRFDAGDFFLDLGTNAIGILISILFIDVILAVLARQEWKSAERLVRKNIAYLAVSSLQTLDRALGSSATNAALKERLRRKLGRRSGTGSEIEKLPRLSLDKRRPEIIAFYESYSGEDAKRQLNELTEEQGASLIAGLDTCVRESSQVIDLYLSKLPVAFVQCILEIQESIFDFRTLSEIGEMEKIEDVFMEYEDSGVRTIRALPSPASAAGAAPRVDAGKGPRKIARYARQTQAELSRLLHQIICKYLQLYYLSVGRQEGQLTRLPG